eukprot:5371653-Karenia_brevis.AAC.1
MDSLTWHPRNTSSYPTYVLANLVSKYDVERCCELDDLSAAPFQPPDGACAATLSRKLCEPD